MRSFTLALAATALLGACATAGRADDEPKGAAKYADDVRLGEEVSRICFASNIDSFGNNDDDTFTVKEGMDHYLIEVHGSCFQLDRAQRIAIDSTTSCLTKGDGIIVSDSISPFDSGTPGGTQRCIVKSMYEWDPKAQPVADADGEGATTE